MKDSIHHLKQLQKKVVRAAKKIEAEELLNRLVEKASWKSSNKSPYSFN